MLKSIGRLICGVIGAVIIAAGILMILLSGSNSHSTPLPVDLKGAATVAGGLGVLFLSTRRTSGQKAVRPSLAGPLAVLLVGLTLLAAIAVCVQVVPNNEGTGMYLTLLLFFVGPLALIVAVVGAMLTLVRLLSRRARPADPDRAPEDPTPSPGVTIVERTRKGLI
jgi:peptidoglycan/LPS O-acetylase OafA/YrhL